MKPLIVALAIACAAAACASSDQPVESRVAPQLMLIDSVQIIEPDSAPLGIPGSILAVGRGYLVADPQNTRLLDIDSTGRVLRSIGRKGDGPSEFSGLGPLALVGDSTLVVLGPSQSLYLIDYVSGAFLTKTTIPAQSSLGIAAVPGGVYFRSLQGGQTPHLALWHADTIQRGPALPKVSELAEVKSSPGAANAELFNPMYAGVVFVALGGDTVAALTQASENIIIATLRDIVRQIPTDRRDRQGIRADLIAQLAADPDAAQRDPQLPYTPSVPAALGRTQEGRFVAVWSDNTFQGNHFSSKLFLSVVDPETGRTCVDARIPGVEDPRPVVALRGDTLVVLSQEVVGVSATNVIRRYRVDTAGCEWSARAAG